MTIVKSSCTRVTRQSTSVIKVGVAYMNVCVSKHLKEELAWAINKLASAYLLFRIVMPLRN